MRIALINGSPKVKESGSGWLLSYVKKHFAGEEDVSQLHFRKAAAPTAEELETLSNADAWVFAFPLYVDGVPGHLLSVLVELEKAGLQNPERKIYGICNCGFYEGAQNDPALEILKNWSAKCGYIWGGAVGIGGGGGTLSFASMGKLGEILMGPVLKSFRKLAGNVCSGKIQENDYVSIALPRAIYQFCAHDGWKKKVKACGGKVKDLERKF